MKLISAQILGPWLGKIGIWTKNLRWSAAGIVVFLVLITSACDKKSNQVIGTEYPYSPAFLDDQLKVLHIFRLTEGERRLELPVRLGPVVYAPNGKALYGFDRDRPGLLKVDLQDMRLSIVPGSLKLRGAAGIALSPDEQRISLSGNYLIGDSIVCGLFDLRPPSGNLRLLIENADCGAHSELLSAGLAMWSRISLSVNGNEVLVRNRTGLKIVNIATGTIDPLWNEFSIGSWSPDGRWLAAVEARGSQRTILLNAKTLKQERTLRNSLAQWSPDSRYLLTLRADFCGPYWSTFGLIDIESGEHLIVSSSKCKVNLNSTGWVQ